jgi:outer membrane lipoprotein SlyB
MRQAQELELMGDMRRAHQLLVQAAQADGTNPTLAYHLARSSDALQEKGAAIDAYCRFLVLSPGTTQAAEVRTRLTALLGAETPAIDAEATQASTGRTAAKSARRTTRAARTTTARTVRPTRLASTGRSAGAARTGGGGATTGSSNGMVDGPMGSAPNEGERVTQSTQAPQVVDAPVTPAPSASTARTANNTARGAIIGAAAGAVVGAAVGRDVKSGVIGAAAGGLLGAAVGRSTTRGQALRGRYGTPTWSPR